MKLLRTLPLVAAVALTACSGDDEPAAVETPSELDVAASDAAEEAEEIEATATPEPPPDRDGDGIEDTLDDYPDDPDRSREIKIRLECDDLNGSGNLGTTVFEVPADKPEFAQVWDVEPYTCDAIRTTGPLRKPEQAAFDASGYEEPEDVVTLYEICAATDPDDTYTSGEHTASAEQLAEIEGVLTLCPDHPLADEIAATADRGRAAIEQEEIDAELEAEGRLIYVGTHLVGDEIQPGTYYIEGDLENCYWERQDSAGEIIDNNFVISARRMEVTIQASDYAFHTDCARWRPVGE